MVESIIGNYLIEIGKITEQQYRIALDRMNSVRVKLGLIAVSEGFMTLQQVEEVNQLQKKLDKRFGDLAVEKNYLTDEQVGKLLKKQGDAYLTFMQALEEFEMITPAEAVWIIDEFKESRGLTNIEMDYIKSDDVDKIVEIMLPDKAADYSVLIAIAIKTIIRIADRHAGIIKVEMKDFRSAAPMAVQSLEGENETWTNGFKEVDGAMRTAASIFAEEDFTEMDEDALDAAAELVNCINGLYASSASGSHGKFLELMPPLYSMDGTDYPEGEACVVTVQIDDKLCEYASIKKV